MDERVNGGKPMTMNTRVDVDDEQPAFWSHKAREREAVVALREAEDRAAEAHADLLDAQLALSDARRQLDTFLLAHPTRGFAPYRPDVVPEMPAGARHEGGTK
jgi:hypothetical protein